MKLIIFLLLFFTFSVSSDSYNYLSYFPTGESYQIRYIVNDNGKLIVGDVIQDMAYEDCSNNKFKCIKIGNDYIFVPSQLNNSGKFSSNLGSYIVYKKEYKVLPLGVKIRYNIIELFPNSNKKTTIFFNEQRGVLAIIVPSNGDDSNSKITWLIGKCGLLASENCIKKADKKRR